MLSINQQYKEEFVYTQQQVEEFARITGDTNPIHLNADYAATTPFKQCIMHGMIGAGVISRIFGIKFPGEGSIYLGQSLEFKRPMYAGVTYEAIVTLKEIDSSKNIGIFTTEIIDKITGKVCTTGEAKIMNKEKIA